MWPVFVFIDESQKSTNENNALAVFDWLSHGIINQSKYRRLVFEIGFCPIFIDAAQSKMLVFALQVWSYEMASVTSIQLLPPMLPHT
jgi:hypothetical protein